MAASRRIKVALIAYRDDPRSGGALRVTEMLAEHLPREQVEAHIVFAYGQAGSISSRVTAPTHFLQAPSSKDLASWRRTRRWFREQGFDLLHFVDPVNWIYFATLGLGIKRIDHFHGCPSQEHVAAHHQMIAICRRWLNDGGIAITHGAKRGVARLGWMSPAKLHVVQNGVSPEQYRSMPDKLHARRQLGLPEDVHLFGEVARFSHGSGLLEIVNILKHLPENWHAVLVGDGPLRGELERQARQQGLRHRLHLPGLLEDVRPAYAALDVVVLLARYQSFCLMLAEAMLARVPVVGLQGAGEYTEPEYPLITSDHAVFFPREHPWDFESVEADEKYHSLAVALQDTVRWPELAAERVDRAERWVKERFSAQLQGQKCLAVYRRVVNNHWADNACHDSV